MKEEKECAGIWGPGGFTGLSGGGGVGNVKIRCQGVAYNDHRGHPVLIYKFVFSPVLWRSLLLISRSEVPNQGESGVCGECPDYGYGEGESEQLRALSHALTAARVFPRLS